MCKTPFLLLAAIVCFCCFRGYGQRSDTLSVYFAYNQSALQPADRAALDRRIAAFSMESVEGIDLSGHCDSIGSDRYNDSLSEIRIAAVRNYLRAKGVADSLLREQHAYGRRQPLDDNRTSAARARNRCVVVVWRERPVAKKVETPEGKAAERVEEKPAERPEGKPAEGAAVEKPIPLEEAFRDTAALKGRNIILNNVYFYGGRHTPLPISLVQLNKLLQILHAHPGWRIEIQGYVCCVPDEEDGLDADTNTHDLSLQRARYVYTYLVGRGIGQDRLSFKGFGGRHKISREEISEDQRAKNRRVEIRVLEW